MSSHQKSPEERIAMALGLTRQVLIELHRLETGNDVADENLDTVHRLTRQVENKLEAVSWLLGDYKVLKSVKPYSPLTTPKTPARRLCDHRRG